MSGIGQSNNFAVTPKSNVQVQQPSTQKAETKNALVQKPDAFQSSESSPVSFLANNKSAGHYIGQKTPDMFSSLSNFTHLANQAKITADPNAVTQQETQEPVQEETTNKVPVRLPSKKQEEVPVDFRSVKHVDGEVVDRNGKTLEIKDQWGNKTTMQMGVINQTA